MPTMHPDEIDIDRSLVSRLIAEQFPQWAHLPIAKVRSAGTDNAIYRLGDDMAVRLPRLPAVAGQVEKEQRWLPRLSPLLPLAIPVPLAVGASEDGFPYPWSVYQWLAGDNLADQPEVDLPDAAGQLGRFVAALQRIDATGGPLSSRATPVNTRDDDDVRSTICHLGADGTLDPRLATAVWEDALAAPAWAGPPAWIHSDLFRRTCWPGRAGLAAVIDFGLLGLGDPACDMLPAWTLLTAQTRDLFRAEAGVAEATWVRGRGWALSAGLGAVRVYAVTNPVLAGAGRHAIAEAVADYRRNA
jgi:aminoglycoside phosphotransferase (APT) family kinase protein